MANSIAPVAFNFNSHEVRTIQQDDAVWFVASDIAKSLNYAEAKDLVRVLDEDEQGRHIVPTPSGDQEMLIINESGLYHALFKSRKKEAQAFRKWVTSEVLPAIRKTGSYSLTVTKEQQQAIKQAVNQRVYKTGETHQAVYTKLYAEFKVPRYQDLPASSFDNVINFLVNGRLKTFLLPNSDLLTLALTDEEFCTLAWLWKVAQHMHSNVSAIAPALSALNSSYAPTFASMRSEHKFVLARAKRILQRETQNNLHHLHGDNWKYALSSLNEG